MSVQELRVVPVVATDQWSHTYGFPRKRRQQVGASDLSNVLRVWTIFRTKSTNLKSKSGEKKGCCHSETIFLSHFPAQRQPQNVSYLYIESKKIYGGKWKSPPAEIVIGLYVKIYPNPPQKKERKIKSFFWLRTAFLMEDKFIFACFHPERWTKTIERGKGRELSRLKRTTLSKTFTWKVIGTPTILVREREGNKNRKTRTWAPERLTRYPPTPRKGNMKWVTHDGNTIPPTINIRTGGKGEKSIRWKRTRRDAFHPLKINKKFKEKQRSASDLELQSDQTTCHRQQEHQLGVPKGSGYLLGSECIKRPQGASTWTFFLVTKSPALYFFF